MVVGFSKTKPEFEKLNQIKTNIGNNLVNQSLLSVLVYQFGVIELTFYEELKSLSSLVSLSLAVTHL